jgi:hypothetical protein
MVYRDRSDVLPPGDSMSTSNQRDRYADNCFLLCLNRDDQHDLPEIHRLETNVRQDLSQNIAIGKSQYQQQSRRRYTPDQRDTTIDNDEFDEYHDMDRNHTPHSGKGYESVNRRKANQVDYYPYEIIYEREIQQEMFSSSACTHRTCQTSRLRSRYEQEPTTDSYYSRERPDPYSRTNRSDHLDNSNHMQHSDDELSVYEVS